MRIIEYFIEVKICLKCKRSKPQTEFHKNKKSKDGLYCYCKDCHLKNVKAYGESEKGKIKIKSYSESEKRKAYLKAYRKAYNKSKKGIAYIKAYQVAYRQLEKGKAGIKTYNQSEKGKSAQKRYKQSEKGKANNRRVKFKYQSQISNNPTLTIKEWSDVEKYYNYKCAYCGSTENIQQDHIIPISKGGKHEKKNVLIACRKCNYFKHAKLPEELPENFQIIIEQHQDIFGSPFDYL